jgi:hypothetical protein
MKKNTSLAIAILLIIGIVLIAQNAFALYYSIVPLSSYSEVYVGSFSVGVPGYVINVLNSTSLIRVNDWAFTGVAGEPMLPYKVYTIVLPPKADSVRVAVSWDREEYIKLRYPLMISSPPVLELGTNRVAPARNFSYPYPGILWKVSPIMGWRGIKVVNLGLFPFQAINETYVKLYVGLRAEVYALTTNDKELAPKLISHNSISNIVQYVSNSDGLIKWYSIDKATLTYTLEQGGVDYVILTGSELVDAFKPLAVLRAAEGMNVGIYTIEWVNQTFPGANLSDKVRAFANYIYRDLGAEYLLLGGDDDIIPTAYMYAEEYEPYWEDTYYKATDAYYAFLDGEWDLDGDGKLLETIDEDGDNYPEVDVEPLPDTYPELYVGRLPVSSLEEATQAVQAIISYETNPPISNNWTNKAIMLAAIANYENEGNRAVPKEDYGKLMNYIVSDILNPNSYMYVRAYEDEGLDPSTYPHEYGLNYSTASQLISGGGVFLMTGGHGGWYSQFKKVWATDDGDNVPEAAEMTWPTFLDIYSNIKPNGRSPVAYVSACLTGWFDGRKPLAEVLLEKGIIAIVASSRLEYYQPGWLPGAYLDQELQYLFWKVLINGSIMRPGPALYLSKSLYVSEHGGITEYAEKKDLLVLNLLGDPALNIIAKQPKVLNLTYGPLRSEEHVLFKAMDASTGEPVEGVLVSIINTTGHVLVSGTTNATGELILTMPYVNELTQVYVTAYEPVNGYIKIMRSETIIPLDIVPPQITIVSPINGSVIGTPYINLTAIANEPISLWQYSVDGGAKLEFSGSIILNLDEGNHTIEVWGYDLSNNTGYASVVFAVDLTPPSLSIISPANNTLTNQTSINIQWVSSDNYGIAYYLILIDGIQYANTTQANYTINNLGEGIHTITLYAVDYGGLNSSESIIIMIDLTPPQIIVNSPSNNTFYGYRVINISVTAFDNYEVTEIYAILLDQYGIEVTTLIGNNISSMIQLNEGNYTLIVKAWDSAGNKAYNTILFYVDLTPPNLTILTPLNETYINTHDVNVSWKGTDNFGISYYTLSVDGILEYQLSETHKVIEGLDDGIHEIEITAVDPAGHSTTLKIIIYIDSEPPEIILHSPKDGIYNTSQLLINATADEDIRKWYIRIDNGDLSEISIPATINLSDGEHIISVSGIDRAGNIGNTSVYIIVDTQPPNVNIIAPSNVFTYRQIIAIAWEGSDNIGITNYELYVNGIHVFSGNNTSYIVTLTQEINNVTIIAVDVAGNINASSILIYYDTVPPSIVNLVPSNNDYINNSVIGVSIKASDNLGIKMIKSTIINVVTDEVIGEWSTTNDSLEIELTLNDGTYVLNTLIQDLANNTLTTQSTFTIDTVKPSIAMTEPANNTYLNKSLVTIKAEAEDKSGIKYMLLYIDNKLMIEERDQKTINTTIYIPDGPHLIRVLAIDKAGNANEVRVNIIVDTLSPLLEINTDKSELRTSKPWALIYVSSDEDLASLKAFLGNSVFEGIKSDGLWIINVSNLVNGRNNVIIKGSDYAGNSVTLNIEIIYEKPLMIPLYIALPLAVAAVLLALVALYYRKK